MSATMVFVDTSVLVAWLCPEPLHDRVAAELAGVGPRLITPLVQLECASALSLRTRVRELTVRAAGLILTELDRQIDAGVFVVRPLDADVYPQATRWVRRFDTPLRAADAVHLASAQALRSRLLTADRALAAAARKLGVACKLLG